MDLAQLEAEIFALPMKDRADLVQRLLLSLEEVSEPEFEKLWGDESARRVAEFDNGSVKAISGKKVAEKARALLR